MSEHGAVLQSNILELVKCEWIEFELVVRPMEYLFSESFCIRLASDIENFKTQRMQLMETLKGEESEKLRVSRNRSIWDGADHNNVLSIVADQRDAGTEQKVEQSRW